MVGNSSKTSKKSVNYRVFRPDPVAAAVRIALAGIMAGAVTQPVHAELPVAATNWVTSGAADRAVNGHRLQINQHSNKVVLNWQSFNIGQGNQVDFAQPGASSIALNKIAQSDPSRILGQLTANGQVYLVNQNGFIFGKNAVIDVNSLIASTHDISEQVFSQGITRVFDENNGQAALVFNDKAAAANQKALKKILIEKGAKITADDGGRIIIVAPDLENHGSLEVGKQGQIMLVASQDKVYLQQADSKDFAGLLVEVDTGGKVSNFGDLLARQGNITMAGFAVNQAGRVRATTSVNFNGSVRLLAREGQGINGTRLVGTDTTRDKALADGLGTGASLIFSAGSDTLISADASAGTAVDEQQQPQSYLEASAHNLKVSSGSRIIAPSAKVKMIATDNILDPTVGRRGKISIERGSTIDVSGIDGVKVAIERNVVEVDVRSFELRDSPQQRGGILNAEKVYVDIRKGTDLVDYSGAKARIRHSIQERMTTGGSIELTASGSVVIEDGGLIDISGGSIDYAAGHVATTKLLNQAGNLFDISEADSKDTFVSLSRPDVFQPGYREGRNAGALSITTALLDWQGDLSASVSNGVFQRDGATRARGGRFDIDLATFLSVQNFSLGNDRETRQLLASGFQDFTLKTLGQVTVEKNSALHFSAFSDVSIDAGSINVDGDLYTAGGKVSLAARLDDVRKTSGEIKIGKGGVIDVSGRWINDALLASQGINPRSDNAINGGQVIITSEGDLNLQQGSVIRADGGAQYTVNNKIIEGKGGSISLSALGRGPFNPASLNLNGSLSAIALLENGSLTLAGNDWVIGNRHYTDKVSKTSYLNASDSMFSRFADITLRAVNRNVVLTGDAHLDLRQQNRVFVAGFNNSPDNRDLKGFSAIQQNPGYLRSAGELNLVALNNVEMRKGSSIQTELKSSVGFTASNSIFIDGRIVDPAGVVSLKIKAVEGEFSLAQSIWLGEHADISLRGVSLIQPDPLYRTGEVMNGGDLEIVAQRGFVVVEKGASIDVSGTSAILDIAINGITGLGVSQQNIGSDAGSVNLTAAEGIVFEGSLFAHGGSPTAKGGSLKMKLDRKTRVDQFNLLPKPELQVLVDSRTDSGFSLDHEFGDALEQQLDGKALLHTAILDNSGVTRLSLYTPDSITFKDNIDLSLGRQITLDAASINWRSTQAGKNGSVILETPYLSIQHTQNDIGGAAVNRTVTGLPETGNGILTAHSGWMEMIGAVKLNGFQQLNFNSDHDIQLRGVNTETNSQKLQSDFVGELVTAADINLRAERIYPSTLSTYQLTIANNPAGTLVIAGHSREQPLPLSAGGALSLNAAHIRQGGRLMAPLGKITLNASDSLVLEEGSLTSVSAQGLTIPFGVTDAGLDWLYPIDPDNNKIVVQAVPEKQIILKGKAIDLAEGSLIDLSGGGDLYAYEFVPGIGGSSDYLQPGSQSNQNSFAIIPGLRAGLAPYDHFQNRDSSFERGELVFLRGGNGLAAGFYTKLPAHYALLPGAYLVTPVENSLDQGLTTATLDNRVIMPGYSAIAGTSIRDARNSGFRVETGVQVRQHTQYIESTADSFFTARAKTEETAVPMLARDGGLISILAQTRLALNARFAVNSQSGSGASMDVAADRISVVNNLSASQNSGVLEILASDLSALNIDSLLLGAGRSARNDKGITHINVIAENVSVDQDVELDVSDLIIAASDKIDIGSGAHLQASVSRQNNIKTLAVQGDGALLRVSADQQVDIARHYATGQAQGIKGILNVSEGAVLQADQSMLLDASRSTVLDGEIVMAGGSLNLGANEINLGEVDGLSHSGALNLSNADLSRLTVDELVLSSRKTVNLLGDVGRLQNDGRLGALTFKRLKIDAMGLVGRQTDQTASIQASDLILQNSQDPQQTLSLIQQLPPTAAGKLNIQTETLKTGEGTFVLAGFDTVNLTANQRLEATNRGRLKVAADLHLKTPLITASGQGDLHLDAEGHQIVMDSTGGVQNKPVESLTGSVKVTADTVMLNTRVEMHSGQFNLEALAGDVILGSQASVDLSGRKMLFDDVQFSSAGGGLTVKSQHGNIFFNKGSQIHLNGGAEESQGGLLKLSAMEGRVFLSGRIAARKGSFDMESSHFGGLDGFNELVETLSASGVNRSIAIHTVFDDLLLKQGNNLKAEQLWLTTDHGSIEIQGSINAEAKEGGTINLAAADKVILSENGSLSATGQGENGSGGRITINATDADQDGVFGIQLQSGTIDLSAKGSGNDGRLLLRGLRTGGNNDVAVDAIGADVIGADRFEVEGVRIYRGNELKNSGQIQQADIAKFKQDNDQFMTIANRKRIEGRLGQGVHLRPGIEVQQPGDLTIAAKLDTADWRFPSIWDTGSQVFDPATGQVVLRASGNIHVNQSISDGFREKLIFGFLPIEQLQSDQSWDFNLVAGANLQGSRWIDSVAGSGSINIAENTHIRTGSGNLGLYAGKDINFAAVTSTIYSAGRTTKTNPFGSLNETVVSSGVFLGVYAEYPVDGGDLVMKAGGNVNGRENSRQYTKDWLVRYQPSFFSSRLKPTAWGVNPAQFKQNVGSFGGGHVLISANDDINDISVMMPITGKQMGQTAANTGGFGFASNKVDIHGGGNMEINAGHNISGGSFLLGRGRADINAGNSITGSQINPDGPLLSMGDSQFDVNAGNDVNITAATDPMIADNGDVNFFSYGKDSALTITSLAGDVNLGAKRSHFSGVTAKDDKSEKLANVYPASLNVIASGGGISVKQDIVLFPSAQGQLSLLARDSLSSEGGNKWVVLSDADSALLPKPESALDTTALSGGLTADRLTPVSRNNLIHAAVPVHLNDDSPVKIVTQTGDIGGINFNLAKKLALSAGRDIGNMQLLVQNIHDTDQTVIKAGRDLRFPILRGSNGTVFNNVSKIEVGGSGSALVQAGRNINLGRAIGISTIGNLSNTALDQKGADLNVLAGINSTPDFNAFFHYLEKTGEYFIHADVSGVVISRQGSEGQKLTFSKLLEAINSTSWQWNDSDYTRLTLPVFYSELKQASKTNDIARGFAATEAMLPGNDWQGDISLFFSKIHTVDGGDINLLAPGGNINVGLSATGGNQKTSSELGIVAQQQGSINTFLSGDFNVNQSRVFALGGSDGTDNSDILVWSSFGNIDAGRGAKSALSVPPPKVSFDENGNLITEFPPAISGSGIRTAASGNKKAGNVTLSAPNGVINAGEAGIGGNNITLVAKAVLGANNIDVGGSSSGVPAQSSSVKPVTGLTSNTTASVSQSAENSTHKQMGDENEEQVALGMLSVEIVGFGSEDQSERRKN